MEFQRKYSCPYFEQITPEKQPRYSYPNLKSTDDIFSKLLGMQDELEKSNQNIENLLESSLQQIQYSRSKQLADWDGSRYSFAQQQLQNEIEIVIKEELEEEFVQKSELLLCQEKIAILESKIEIYESALKGLEEDNNNYQIQLSQAKEYQKLYDLIINNEKINKLQQGELNIFTQMHIVNEINVILQKEISSLKVDYNDLQECPQREQLRKIDKSIQFLQENQELIKKIEEKDKLLLNLKKDISILQQDNSRLKSINHYLHQQVEKKQKL